SRPPADAGDRRVADLYVLARAQRFRREPAASRPRRPGAQPARRLHRAGPGLPGRRHPGDGRERGPLGARSERPTDRAAVGQAHAGLRCAGVGPTSPILAGLDWVRQNRVAPAVANMSLGGGLSTALNDATTNLWDSGVFVAVAAGNDNADACHASPASANGA